MDSKRTFSLSYEDLTSECVKMIKELQTSAASLDGIGYALVQTKIQAVLVLWSRLATAGNACQLNFVMDRQYLIQMIAGNSVIEMH
ncbi:hypothetical protein Q2380_09045 [Enterobacter hormaechei]|uniref:hypothetical protein n=1 Tax=Enterobacter hormaechei TaxID=158836 RepID=UPI002665D51F|nr:hypothetical protein [Enterobacter hormaechei]MDO2399726.1 hypothetical protein [Enterobacter hormaechei]MDO2403218.1 hypothetical protein [Enterobacter hormaechei]MDO2419223.1 hypothetical protein [Enterobacter hormaechei]MDO2427162.1 hypothetical protein [Enterobacter hormaechei]HBL6085494.1 hypothetical protein [Enterobacter hormaechei]